MDLVVVPFHDVKKWQTEGWRTRDAHLVSHFESDSRINKILVVNRPVSLIECLYRKGNWKTRTSGDLEKRHNYNLGIVENNVYSLDILLPDVLSVLAKKKGWWSDSYRSAKVSDGITEAIDRLKMKAPILLLQNPMSYPLAEEVSHSSLVFDAIDNWMLHPQMKSNLEEVITGYRYIDTHADLIITVSNALTSEFRRNSNVHQISNGVDVEYFAPARKPLSANRPTIGYIGKIQDRVDFSIIEQCAKLHSESKILIIGPIYSQKQTAHKLMRKYRNIEFTGDISYAALPERMKELDIAIIPHKANSFTESMNPLKLYEYLAAGKPVVTTDISGVHNVSPYVFIASDNMAFENQINKLINRINSGDIQPEAIANSIPDQYTWNDIEQKYISYICETVCCHES